MQLASVGAAPHDESSQSYELAVGGGDRSGGKLLGHREFARFYKQRHHPVDTRESVAANAVLSKYVYPGLHIKLFITDGIATWHSNARLLSGLLF